MCNKIDCPLYGGACGMAKLRDSRFPFVSCYEYDNTIEEPDCEEIEVRETFVLTSAAITPSNVGFKTKLFSNMASAMDEMLIQYAAAMSKLKLSLITPDEYFTDVPNGTGLLSFRHGDIHYKWTIERKTVNGNTRKAEAPTEVRVRTPGGTLIAYNQGNSSYPGIAVDFEFENEGEIERIGIANLEWGEGHNSDKKGLFAGLFTDLASDDCTNYLPFTDSANIFNYVQGNYLVINADGSVKKGRCPVDVCSGQVFGVNIKDDSIGAFVEINRERYVLYPTKPNTDVDGIYFWCK